MLIWYHAQIALGRNDPIFIRDYIAVEALMMGVDTQIPIGVAERESHFNCDAQGDYASTTQEYTSFGCFQIHLPAHPSITKEEAHDIIWATQWSIKEMKENGCRIWSTCKETMKAISAVDG